MASKELMLLRAHELISTTKEYLHGYAIHELDTFKPFTEVTEDLQDWLNDYETSTTWVDGLLINLGYWLPLIALGCATGAVIAAIT